MERTAIVTGARRGIGLAVAEELAQAGFRVVLAAVSPPQEAAGVVARFRENGWTAEYQSVDISKVEDRRGLFDRTEERYGKIDVLVNNAGVAPQVRADLLEMTQESFDRVLSVNLRGTFFMCQEAAGRMIAAKRQGGALYTPRIINIGSISAYTASVSRGEYCSSKAGVSMGTSLFASRLAEEGIPVFEVRPGIILTDMTAAVQEKYQRMIEAGITPIRRFGRPKDVADCVMAAVSGRLDFATGQVLNADGGFHLRRL